MKEGETLRAYGQSVEDMEKIRHDQIHHRVVMVPANNLKTLNDELFAKDYADLQIPEHDAMHYHLARENREFNQQTGQRKSKPWVSVLDTATFNALKNMKPHDGFFGQTIAILHDPTKGDTSLKGRFRDLDEAKRYYGRLTGNVAGKFWNMLKTIEEIEIFEHAQKHQDPGLIGELEQGESDLANESATEGAGASVNVDDDLASGTNNAKGDDLGTALPETDQAPAPDPRKAKDDFHRNKGKGK